MTTDRTAGVLLIAGALLFLVGAAVAVPAVFTKPDPAARQRMLERHLGRWRLGQPMYGVGPVIASAGVGRLAAGASAGGTRVVFAVASSALLTGSLAWAWSLYLRATRISDFTHGRLPGWPFTTYVALTIVGLALLGAGLLSWSFTAWPGWLCLSADLLFVVLYVRFKDIPPFVFYVLILVVGVALV